ncbi:MAG: response regulator [Sphingobium sp.]
MGLLSASGPPRPKVITSILIVEDEPLLAFDNEQVLERAGYQVVDTVDRYSDAVEALARGGIDLILADVNLAGSHNGMDLARHARTLDIPVLFASASDPGNGDGCAIGWLAKPYAARDLVRAIAVVGAILSGGSPSAVPGGMRLFAVDPAS